MFIRISKDLKHNKLSSRITKSTSQLPLHHSSKSYYSKKNTNQNLGDLGSLGNLEGVEGVKEVPPPQKFSLKNLQLEAQVYRLFRSTIDQSTKGVNLHPDDVELQREAQFAQERLLARLSELHQNNPDSFERLVDLITEDDRKKAEKKETDKFLEGTVPGTRNPPWAGSAVWKSFFDDLKREMAEEDPKDAINEEQLNAEIRKMDGNEQQILDPISALAGDNTESRAISNQLEDSFKMEELADKPIKKCRGSCLFCSDERDQFPLEPMNIHLLTSYMTSAGFIKSRRQTGLCKKMQSRVSKTIKHARALGLFSYKSGSFRIRNPVISPEE